jgi:hypothetical protein
LNIFFIRGVGSGCEQAGGTASSPTCPHPSKSKYLCCCSGHQITVSFSGFGCHLSAWPWRPEVPLPDRSCLVAWLPIVQWHEVEDERCRMIQHVFLNC